MKLQIYIGGNGIRADFLPEIKCGTLSAPTGIIKVVTEEIELEAMSINLIEIRLFKATDYCYCNPLTWP